MGRVVEFVDASLEARSSWKDLMEMLSSEGENKLEKREIFCRGQK